MGGVREVGREGWMMDGGLRGWVREGKGREGKVRCSL